MERLPSMDELLGRHVDMGSVRKIGEGTFGEAFAGGEPHSPFQFWRSALVFTRLRHRRGVMTCNQAVDQQSWIASAAMLYMSRCKGVTSQQGLGALLLSLGRPVAKWVL